MTLTPKRNFFSALLSKFMDSDWRGLAPLALLGLLAFAPCLFFGQAYYSNDLLTAYEPQRAFLKDSLLNGFFPLWNPYLQGGTPFFAHPENMAANPLNYLTLFFPNFGVFFLLHLWIAFLGVFLYLKGFSLSVAARVFGSLAYGFSNFFWLEIIHPTILASFSWFPWLLLCLENLASHLRIRWAFWSGLTYALLFLSGSAQMGLGAFYGGAIYFVIRLYQLQKAKILSRRIFSLSRLSEGARILLVFLGGALPILILLIPANEFSNLCTRRASTLSYDQFNSEGSMRPKTADQFFVSKEDIPLEEHENRTEEKIYQEAGDSFLSNYGFCGALSPFLIFLALIDRRREKVFLPLIALGIFSLALALGKYSFFHRLLCEQAPGFAFFRCPYRFIFIYVFCAAVLAAFGFEHLRDRIRKPSRIFFYLGIAILALLADWGLDNLRQTWPEVASSAALLFIFIAVDWRMISHKTFSFLLLFIISGAMLLNARSFYPTASSSIFHFAENFPLFSILQKKAGEFRTTLDPSLPYQLSSDQDKIITWFPENAAGVLKIRTWSGYSPLILQSFNDLFSLPLDRAACLLGVPILIFGEDKGNYPGLRHTVQGTHHFYTPLKPAEMAWAPRQFQVLSDPSQRLESLRSEFLNFYDKATLSEPLPSSVQNQLSGKKTKLQYSSRWIGPNRQAFSLVLDIPSVVVFSEIMFPGWQALLDGKPTEIFTADHALRAVFIPAGSHHLEFRYIPAWLKPLAIGFLAWLLGVFIFMRRYRRGPLSPR